MTQLDTMPGDEPLVSVIIPTHNSASFIAQALHGVLAQTYRSYEVIVVDDGSSDDTRDVLRPFLDRISYLYQDNQGPSSARNAGIRKARGQFICLLDADDRWREDKLKLQVELMAARPDVGLLFTDAEEVHEAGVYKHSILATMIFGPEVLSRPLVSQAFQKLLVENFVPTSTVMMRKTCLLKAGLFDEALQNAEDRDQWLRLAAISEVACLPQVLATKRSHGSNISSRTEVALRSRIKVWNKARRDWPTLAPPAVYQRMLAGAYQELGYILLTRGERREARRYGIASLRTSWSYIVATRSRLPQRGLLAIGLVPLSLFPWPLVQFLWQLRNQVIGRNDGLTKSAAAK